MNLFTKLAQTVISLVIVYILAVLLKKKNILSEEHSLILARIITTLCLPAVVFVNIARIQFTAEQLYPALLMLAAELVCVTLAWGVSKLLRLPRDICGPVVFCSAFGSSTFLGYAIIMQLYPAAADAMTQAVLISEIGVGYPIFILGPLLGAYFGSEQYSLKQSLAFFKSPVFFALILGLLWNPLGLPGENNTYFAPLFAVCGILSQALTPLAILSVGLMFKVPPLKLILIPLAITVAIKLLLKPLGLGMVAQWLGYPTEHRDILVLLAAMPSAVLGAVFLRQHGGNARLASSLLLSTTILSCGSILLVFRLIG